MVANVNILSDKTKVILNSNSIYYKVLNKSKCNTLAFVTNQPKRREFEIVFMKDGTYRVQTRFLGYRQVMKDFGLDVIKTKDPDGRRWSYRVELYYTTDVNRLLVEMINKGYSRKPAIDTI